MTGPVLIVGAGYLGSALARRLRAEQIAVTLWTRTAASAARASAEGYSVVCGNAADPAIWRSQPREWARVVLCTATGGNPKEYDEVYRQVAQAAIGHLDPAVPLLFTSSTSVYGDMDGLLVTEGSSTAWDESGVDTSSTRYILAQTERLLFAREGGQVARLTGIYGPGRTPTLDRLRSGDARLEEDGHRFMNHIYLDDILTGLRVFWSHPEVRCVNVADGNPATQREVYQWLCERLGLEFPRPAPVSEAGTRRRGGSHRRISSAALQNLGWRPAYPSFREGYEAILSGGA